MWPDKEEGASLMVSQREDWTHKTSRIWKQISCNHVALRCRYYVLLDLRCVLYMHSNTAT